MGSPPTWGTTMYQRRSEERFDDSLVTVLYQRYARNVLHYVQRSIPLKEDADDLVSEVFMAMLDRPVWVEWNEGAQLAWLLRVARNKVVDHLRQVARRPLVELDEALEAFCAEEHHTPEQIALRNEDRVQLRAHLSRLSVLQQEILHLRFADGLQTKEIARILHRSDNVVRVLLSRSLHSLRSIYDTSLH